MQEVIALHPADRSSILAAISRNVERYQHQRGVSLVMDDEYGDQVEATLVWLRSSTGSQETQVQKESGTLQARTHMFNSTSWSATDYKSSTAQMNEKQPTAARFWHSLPDDVQNIVTDLVPLEM